MAVMSDRWIREAALSRGMIEPFVDRQNREGVISYGLSSYGYDARVAPEFRIFTDIDNALVDPKHFDERSFVRSAPGRPASSRPTASRWHARSNTSAYPATSWSSAWARAPMRAAG